MLLIPVFFSNLHSMVYSQIIDELFLIGLKKMNTNTTYFCMGPAFSRI